MPGRLTLLLTSPRVVAGILSRDGWRALEDADLVAGREDEPQVQGIQDVGMPVTHLPEESAPELARALVARATAETGNQVVWIGSSDGDPGLTDALANEVSRLPDPPEVEVVLGSHDVQGSRLLDLVAVMDRLRSPDGCPWDAEQTHESLVPYLIEEAHEAAEALESGDRDHMVEELGDVLLQVAFHARVAEEHESDPFDIDDVAGAIVAKLVRRHPHVFADSHDTVADSASVEANWESIKAEEKAARARARSAEGSGAVGSGAYESSAVGSGADESSADASSAGVSGADASSEMVSGEPDLLHGIPVAMPPLARATKVVSRLLRAGRTDVLDATLAAADPGDPGARLLALVAELKADGVDPDAALRSALRGLTERVGPGTGAGEPLG